METFSVLLAICAENSPVPGEFPAQRPVTRSFDVFFDLRLNKRLSKQSRGWWFGNYRAHYEVTVMRHEFSKYIAVLWLLTLMAAYTSGKFSSGNGLVPSGINWSNFNLTSVRSTEINLRALSQKIPQTSVTTISFKKHSYLNFHSCVLGGTELNATWLVNCEPINHI